MVCNSLYIKSYISKQFFVENVQKSIFFFFFCTFLKAKNKYLVSY